VALPSATTDSERRSGTPETQNRLISISARGKLPTGNPFGLREWKLVKEEEEKQQQKVKIRWTVPALPYDRDP